MCVNLFKKNFKQKSRQNLFIKHPNPLFNVLFNGNVKMGGLDEVNCGGS